MEGRIHRWTEVTTAALVIVVSLPPSVARAEDPPYEDPVNVTVDTQPDSVVVEAETDSQAPGGTGTQASGPSGPKCYLRRVPASDWDDNLELQYWSFRMQKTPYYLYCDGAVKSVLWFDIPDAAGPMPPSTDPRDIAMRLRDEMPIPRVEVSINPSRGLAGVDAWFWIEGYAGTPLTDSTDAFGDLVQVEARVGRYEWAFGDGTTLASDSPGQPYPARSSVRHVYERSSAGLPAGYSVEVDFVFTVRYRVNGGGWIELPGITRTAQADYEVRESQAVIQQ